MKFTLNYFNGESRAFDSEDYSHYYNNVSHHPERRAEQDCATMRDTLEEAKQSVDLTHSNAEQMKSVYDAWAKIYIDKKLGMMAWHKNQASAFIVGPAGFRGSNRMGWNSAPDAEDRARFSINAHIRKFDNDILKLKGLKPKPPFRHPYVQIHKSGYRHIVLMDGEPAIVFYNYRVRRRQIRFPNAPKDTSLALLKSAGFRWSKKNKNYERAFSKKTCEAYDKIVRETKQPFIEADDG